METTLFKSITVNLPLTQDQLHLYVMPLLFTLFLIPFAIFYFLKFKRKSPFYPFSLVDFSLKFTKDKLFQIEDKMSFLRLLSFTVLALALPAPTLMTQRDNHLFHKRELPPSEGSALFILLDQSASMATPFGTTRQIDYLKEVTKDFIVSLDKDQPPQRKDLIGLMGFARYPYVIVPPTFEHDILIDALDRFDVIGSKEGEGTSMSYAIYKTAHLIHFLEDKSKLDTHFNLDSSAIVLITDGVESISPEDVNKPYLSVSMDQASSYAAKYHIPLYLVVLFPKLNEAIYAPQKKNLQNAAKRTGGELFILNHPKEVDLVLKKIETMKKAFISSQEASTYLTHIPLWPYFLWTGFFLFLLYVFLHYGYYRMAP